MKILVINGPNLNRLGKRRADHYGIMTLEDLEEIIKKHARQLDMEVEFFQSNYEGAIIDVIHQSEGKYQGAIINPGAFTHYSYAIRDAIECVELPFVEVHLSDIHSREPFRALSVTEAVCIKQISGQREQSYTLAIDYLKEVLKGE